MPNYRSKITFTLIIATIVFVLCLGMYLIFRVNALSNLPNNVTKKEELTQLPVDYIESNTMAVVCPNEARGNSSYPDLACRNTQYYGTSGLNQAILDGGLEHTVYIKNGMYNVGFGVIVPRRRYLKITGESRDGVVLYRSGKDEANLMSTLLLFKGDGGVVVENITFVAPKVFVENPQYNIVGVGVGENTAATIKNNAFYNLHQGIFLDKNTQDVKIYQNVFHNNYYGLYSLTDKSVFFENNIVTNSLEVGVVFETTNATRYTDPSFYSGLDIYGTYETKTVMQNVFYENKYGVSIVYPYALKMINNIFTDNTEYNLLVPKINYSLKTPLADSGNVNVDISYNYSNLPAEKFCAAIDVSSVEARTDCGSVFNNQQNYSNITQDIYILDNKSTGEYNFRLSESGGLIDKGNPSYPDRDRTRSDPGAYGGVCRYDSDGCYGLEFPNLSNIPVIDPSDGVVYDPDQLDLNNDGRVDVIDIIQFIKFVFR